MTPFEDPFLFDASPLLHAELMDDRNARKTAERYGLVVCGTMRLVALACARGDYTLVGASTLADTLRESGMRLPFAKGGFATWAQEKKLLG